MPRLSAPPPSPPSSTWLRLSISLQPGAWQPQLRGWSCCLAACNSKPERVVCLRCCLFRVLRCVRLPNHVWMNNDTNLTKHKMYRRKEGRRLHKRHAAQKCIHASKCASEKWEEKQKNRTWAPTEKKKCETTNLFALSRLWFTTRTSKKCVAGSVYSGNRSCAAVLLEGGVYFVRQRPKRECSVVAAFNYNTLQGGEGGTKWLKVAGKATLLLSVPLLPSRSLRLSLSLSLFLTISLPAVTK